MVKWILIAIAVLAVLAAVVALIGSRLPEAHTASRSAEFAVPSDVVWRAMTDVDAFPTWRTDVKTVQRLPDRDGRPMWVEQGSNGTITYAIERQDAPRLLVVRIADPDLPFGGTWTYAVAPSPSGSVLTITENGEVYNPLFRFMSRYVFGHEATLNTYITSLTARLARG